VRDASFDTMTPAELIIDTVTAEADRVLVSSRAVATSAACPDCGRVSTQVHSRYHRRLLDLPSHGRVVHLRVEVRRFRCANVACSRRIFGEQLADSVAPRAARRTSRLERIVHHLGVALGGRPAATLPRRLMLPVRCPRCLRDAVGNKRRLAGLSSETGRVLASLQGARDMANSLASCHGQRIGSRVF
jgi:hypothetical protein